MDDDGYTFLIAEAEVIAPADGFGEGATDVERHVRIPGLSRAREVRITSDQLEDFWDKKVIELTDTLASAQAKKPTTGFTVDEISFAIGVGAKGGLLFVAEASLQATITVKLKRSLTE